VLVFRGGAYWGDCNQADADAVVHRSVELGINYFDAAEAYNAGRSEESLGIALQGVPRDAIVVGTKVSPRTATLGRCPSIARRLSAASVWTTSTST